MLNAKVKIKFTLVRIKINLPGRLKYTYSSVYVSLWNSLQFLRQENSGMFTAQVDA